MRILYELHSLKQRRAYTIIRVEIEESSRKKVENEVKFVKHNWMIYKLKKELSLIEERGNTFVRWLILWMPLLRGPEPSERLVLELLLII